MLLVFVLCCVSAGGSPIMSADLSHGIVDWVWHRM